VLIPFEIHYAYLFFVVPLTSIHQHFILDFYLYFRPLRLAFKTSFVLILLVSHPFKARYTMGQLVGHFFCSRRNSLRQVTEHNSVDVLKITQSFNPFGMGLFQSMHVLIAP